MSKNERKLAKCLQDLVEIICGNETNVTIEDCDEAKQELQRVTGHEWDTPINV